MVEFNEDGLTTAEAQKRLAIYGPNAVVEKVTPWWRLLLLKFWGPMPILIEIAIILSLVNAIASPEKDYVSFVVLLLLLLINGFIGFFEERNAGNAINALKKSLAPKCSVMRDGVWQVVDAKDLVPGDFITVKLGDIIPADAKIHKGNLEVDESALTGESFLVTVAEGESLKSGSIVRVGETEAFVTATGANTYIGEAMKLVAQSSASEGHFQKVLFNVAKVIIVIALLATVLIFCLKVFKDGDHILPVLDLCLVLLVASIPIAMQVVCTGTMAVGSRKLAAHNVIVSRLGAIEELAGMTILCSDKTGTLTLNKLQMRDPWTMGSITPEQITFCACLASKRVNPDAIDDCIYQGTEHKDKLEEFEELDFVPFDPVAKRTEATVREKTGGKTTFRVTKGAPQVILGLTANYEELAEEVELKIKEYAERGLRSLAVARCLLPEGAAWEKRDQDSWEFMGMLSFHDPPRGDTKQTIETAKTMGVEVKMITGDHLAIGKETARLLGMGGLFYGKEFLAAVDDGKANIDGRDVGDIVEAADGFAQVAPKHKFFIVDQLQKRGHLTGMTGDGVNDAPALKKADIGIAVDGATEAAKAASDIVLLTPGLSVIITAIIRSRKIFQRMKNYCIYRIICTFQLLLFFTIAISAFNFSIPAISLVLITLLNDGTIMTIAHDNVIPAKKPEAWKLGVIAAVACVVGTVATIGLFVMYFLYTTNKPSSADNYFGFTFDQQCYYTIGDMKSKDPHLQFEGMMCAPLCRGGTPFNPKWEAQPTCPPGVVGWSEAVCVIYMCLSVGGQLTVYIARTKHSFWSRRPGYTLMAASAFAQIASTFLAVYWPVQFKISAAVGIANAAGQVVSSPVVMKGIGWEMAGIVWGYCIGFFLLEDLIKVYFYYAVDNDNKTDEELAERKRKQRAFLPSVTRLFNKKKNSRNSLRGNVPLIGKGPQRKGEVVMNMN